ncbi:MAG: hypothetical protein J6A15_07580 [Clostridia bacterium]|nr:hypothetical protein [Clostridia bacterium]
MRRENYALQTNTSFKSKANLLSIFAPLISADNNSLTYNLIFVKNT